SFEKLALAAPSSWPKSTARKPRRSLRRMRADHPADEPRRQRSEIELRADHDRRSPRVGREPDPEVSPFFQQPLFLHLRMDFLREERARRRLDRFHPKD